MERRNKTGIFANVKNNMAMQSVNIFRVTKDKAVRYVTFGTWALIVVVFSGAWWAVLAEPFILIPCVVMALVTLSVLGVLFYYYAISPRCIEVTADGIVLHRVRGRKLFPYADIAEAAVWRGRPSSMLRYFGSGAFCGYIGWFSGGGLGSHFEYVGRYSDAFYIRLHSGRTYLLSCEDSEKVVKHIESALAA